jgi:hypothetical protein
MPDKTSSVLERMTADVVNRKRKVASVPAEAPRTAQDARNGQSGTEAPPVDPVVAVGLEVTGNIAQSRELLLGYLAEIEAAVSHARFTLDLLFQPLRLPTDLGQATPESIEALRKQAEAEADRRFAERQAELAAKAQAATYQPEPDAWVCPEHGKSTWKTSPKGRRYLACPDCDEFERAR